MTDSFVRFATAARSLAPRTAIVLGSGLGEATQPFLETLSLPFGEIPGLVPATVHGHNGRVALGHWGDVPVLLCCGRLHLYEGHPLHIVTGAMRIVADLGAKTVILSNAAGGIHPSLSPGCLMAIHRHIKWLGSDAWRATANAVESASPYASRLLQTLSDHEARAGRELLIGTYAALSGPCYETPAEILALRTCGADAVGMSTALEAEAAIEFGLEVAAISCITNKASGLSEEPPSHREVIENARLAVTRLGELFGVLVQSG